jgi:hypothetical protein
MRWLLASLFLVSCLVSCGSEPQETSAAFADLETVTTDGGLTIAVRASPSPPVRGVDSFELTVKDGDQPIEGLSLEVEPWMASHNHGASVVPEVSALGSGKYLVKNVSLFMPGRWELRTHVTGPAAKIDDHASIAVDVP